MDVTRGQIVHSRAGHDKDGLFCVVDTDGAYLLLSDGKNRKLARPKRKGRKHVRYAGESTHPAIGALCSGQPVLDSDIRRALAAFRDQFREVGTLGKK